MVKQIIPILALLVMFASFVMAQEPTAWSIETAGRVRNLNPGDTLQVTLKAEIDKNWKLYALEQPDGGPVPTTVKPAKDSKFEANGSVTSARPITKFDPNFKIETKFFTDSAVFDVPLKAREAVSIDAAAVEVRFQVCDDKVCLPPKTLRVDREGSTTVRNSSLFSNPDFTGKADEPLVLNSKPPDQPIWAFIWLAVSLGALSLLTPCVFPMIPITVSYFTKNASGSRATSIKLASVYSAGIVATFTLLGMLLAVFVGAAGINLFAANPWVNIAIAAIFLFFAFNLFGFYEITVPSGVLSKLDRITRTKEGEGSAYIGALLMGLTFTVTSFTCTSPFVGTILVSTAQGDWKLPLVGMLAFSTVFALPFFVLALAPQLVSQLPKSGGWLNSVKVVMGFLEVAAALKFISNVDLVWTSSFVSSQGGVNYGSIFSREVVLGLWVLISLAIALYVIGVFKFKMDSPLKRRGPSRVLVAMGFLILGGYLTTGIFGRKLGELESFLPPKNVESVFNLLGDKDAELVWIKNDLPGALEKARLENKRVFVDFTGYTCTNCRWMEANMYPIPDIRREMDKYVLVSLYTDGDGEIYYRQQKYQEDTFKTVALPFYAILDADGRPLKTFPGLTRDEKVFLEFLQK